MRRSAWLLAVAVPLAVPFAACTAEGPIVAERPEPAARTLVVSSLGNSAPVGEARWTQRAVSAVAVAADGAVFANSASAEFAPADSYAGIYKAGRALRGLQGLDGRTRQGGRAVAVGGGHAYLAVRQASVAGEDGPPPGAVWFAVRRYDLDGAPAPFPGGKGSDGSLFAVSATEEVTALAVSAEELFVGRASGVVDVFDAGTLAAKRTMTLPSFELRGPELRGPELRGPELRGLALDGRGTLWALDGARGEARAFTPTGVDAGRVVALGGAPVALALGADERLYVADAGARQQIRVHDLRRDGGPLVRTIGATAEAASGGDGPDTLRFRGLSGVGIDAAGTVYVAMNTTTAPDGRGAPEPAGARLLAIGPDDRLRWEAHALVGVECAAVDPGSDGRVVYTRGARFAIDFWRPVGDEVRWSDWTFSAAGEKDDPRRGAAGGAPLVRIVGGRRLLFDRAGQELDVYRFEGARAIPAGRFGLGPPPAGAPRLTGEAWIWRDEDGDGAVTGAEIHPQTKGYGWGYAVDDAGTVLRASEDDGLLVHPLEGIDARGVPRHAVAPARLIPIPPPFVEIERVEVAGDALYVSGYTAERPKPTNEWGFLGTALARYDGLASGALRLRWTLPLVGADLPRAPRAFAVAGKRLFVAFNHAQAVFVFDADSAERVARLDPGAGPPAAATRLFYGLSAFQRKNGEYLVLHEASWWARVLMYRMPPDWRGP